MRDDLNPKAKAPRISRMHTDKSITSWASVVIRVIRGAFKFLLGGDLGNPPERKMSELVCGFGSTELVTASRQRVKSANAFTCR